MVNNYFGHNEPENDYFKVNLELVRFLQNLNEVLSPAEQPLKTGRELQWPCLFLVGMIRTGTTLFMQWLAQTEQWAYPSNLLSRFYRTPGIGAMLQQLLFHPDYQVGKEFQDLKALKLNFTSHLGKTSGVLAPNSFTYFWRHLFPFQAGDWISRDALEKTDSSELVQNLALLEDIFQKPFAIKAQILNYHLDYLAAIVPSSLFVVFHRDPIQIASSILKAREQLYGDNKTWFSFQIDEYEKLKDLSPYHQVAGQIFHTQKAVNETLKHVPEHRKLYLDYEEFCRYPENIYLQLKQLYAGWGHELNDYQGPRSFEPSVKNLEASEQNKIQQALSEFGL